MHLNFQLTKRTNVHTLAGVEYALIVKDTKHPNMYKRNQAWALRTWTIDNPDNPKPPTNDQVIQACNEIQHTPSAKRSYDLYKLGVALDLLTQPRQMHPDDLTIEEGILDES